MMKRFLISLCMVFGMVSTAHAVPYCYKGTIIQSGFNYLTPAQLQLAWNANPPPANNASPHWYVAFHAAHQYCKTRYGSAFIVTEWGPPEAGPYNIAQGIKFRCGTCIPGFGQEPGPVDPAPVE